MLADLRAAFALLTILPFGSAGERKPGYAFAYFPLVGLALGAILSFCAGLHWPSPALRGFVLLLLWVVLTGALHLDGFGDACDGLFATTTPTRRLEIMKDPRTGAWAVVGIVLLLLGKWVTLQTTPALALWLIPMVARWAMVLAAAGFRYARPTGFGGYFRAGLGWPQVLGATVFTGVASALIIGLRLDWSWLILSTPVLAVLLFGRWAAARLGGGLTGDVYGAMGELTELAALLLVALMPMNFS